MGLHFKPTVIIVDSYTAGAIASSERWKLIQYFWERELKRILTEEFVFLATHCKLHSAVFIPNFSFFLNLHFLVGCAVVFLDLDMEDVDYMPKTLI